MRKLLTTVGLTILASMLVLGNAPAWALPAATGTGSCKFVSGSGGFDDQINQTGVASVTQVHIKFTVNANRDCSISVVSPAGDIVKGIASLSGTGTYTRAAGFADACANFVGGDVVKVKVKVKWIASSPIANTKAVFGTGSYSPPGSASVLTYSGAIGWAGSFLTSSSAGRVVLATSLPDFTACTPSTKVDSFTISGSYIQV
jgi:hypothetical protein